MIPLRDDLPTSRPPVLTVGLIAANVAVFLWQVLGVGMEASVAWGGLVPARLLGLVPPPDPAGLPAVATLLSSMFLHGSFAHIGGNMLFLWVFGNNVEDALGRPRYLAFYLLTGIGAAAAQTGAALVAGNRDLLIPMVGASGAISGVLAAYLVMFPRARVLTLVPIFVFIRFVQLPASLFLGLWFVFQLLGAFLGDGGGGVAFMAHVGGFVAGLLLVLAWRPRRRARGARAAAP
ncbi:MAG: rhomboid family intramembrane serine protease [Deltaproteobacteria bacterium]|nr:rhomboid family intramembrane serine protease [Deltaproteobacteria bacterium]